MNINSVILDELRKEFGETFYLLDSAQFKKNYIELKKQFSEIYPRFNIAYSYKTNYVPKLCKIVNDFGGYAEVVSEMEVELALRVGVSPERIIWNGPIKNTEYLEKMLLKGTTINIDSIEEYYLIKDLAEKYPDNMLNVGIRCNFDVQDGVISRFGLDIEGDDFKKVFESIEIIRNLKLINLQCHFAKRQIDYWPARAKRMIELIEKLGIIPQRIDLGGGLYGNMAESLKEQFNTNIPEYKDYANAVAPIFAEKFKDAENCPELLIEPGSALVGDCMRFASTVKTIKTVREKTFVSVLGSQKNISMTGVNPPMTVYSLKDDQQDVNKADIVGFTCIESDVLYKNYTGKIARGDMVVFENCGSYSLVMKPPFILPNFPVLDISEGKIEVIKRAETFEDIFHTYNM